MQLLVELLSYSLTTVTGGTMVLLISPRRKQQEAVSIDFCQPGMTTVARSFICS